MYLGYSRKGSPLTPRGSARRRHLSRPERVGRSAVVYLGLVLVGIVLFGAAVHNVRFFFRRGSQADILSEGQLGNLRLSGDTQPHIGIDTDVLLDGGEGSKEEHTALAVSKERSLVEAGDDTTLFLDSGAEDKLLGGVEMAGEIRGVHRGSSNAGKGAVKREWEEEKEVLDEVEIALHKLDGGAVENSDEEDRGAVGEKEGSEEFEMETDAEGGAIAAAGKGGAEEESRNGDKKVVGNEKGAPAKKKSGHSSCETHFASSAKALAEPNLETRRFESFELKYLGAHAAGKEGSGEGPTGGFNGRQTWDEREESFHIQDPMTIHCGFMGPGGGSLPGFHLDPQDSDALASCHIAVVSATFGASDAIHSISKSQVSDLSHRTVCFVLFLDAASLAAIKKDRKPGISKDGRIGIWRPVVVRPPLPYDDPRRIGKIPKLLTHRVFPRARYSIWIDAKLKLAQDPRAVLERFLWREKAEFAISNHYDRHDVREEVVQNKKLNKYDHRTIDEQYETYVREGLDSFNGSDPNRPLLSYVPEGSLIIREHTPMSNLFSCLWFNEVDRFTSRDQLSFAHTFLKLTRSNPDRKFRLKMFLDCERRATAKLYRHRADGGSTQRKRTAH
ncbi:hypothetical protein KFL_000410030 [Klebsormidium nitens]|uniref:TOD1/MUCI70 glycosyltransferase-like domain-containing protein n=1 Tax=Klebsormidium nitens TaxID=105231 RepID=A0A1Y1HPC8_KLENI|nr:hypothetical protein KFL_000410030 [Klebsormidium nitens]|eukprot:GAQ79903.1 hypothetical protein KFL_000410030 [Klebsormidium nitens]